MGNPYVFIGGAVLAGMVVWGVYGMGERAGRDACGVQAATEAIARADAAAETERIRGAAATAAIANVAGRQARAVARVAEVRRREAAQPAHPAVCDFGADELRLSQARWCAAYGDRDPAACGLSDGLRAAPAEVQPAPGMDGPDAAGGTGLRVPARPLRGLGAGPP